MQIEKVTPKTAWQAGQIYATSWKSAYAGIVPQPYLDGLSAGVWAPQLGCLVYTDFVLKDGGRYVATASVTAARDPAMHGWGEVVSIYVLPECTGLGYGKALFAHAVTAATVGNARLARKGKTKQPDFLFGKSGCFQLYLL